MHKYYREMKSINLIFIVFLTILSCSEQNEFVYPLIQTGEVTDIDITGAVFHASITDLGKGNILEYGFVWGLTGIPDLKSSKIGLNGPVENGILNLKISSDLLPDTIYYVRAFARNETYTTYGKVVTFRSTGSLAPEILDFNPKEGAEGTLVTINGKNFSGGISGNKVKFGKATAIVAEASFDKLTVSLPSDLKVSGRVNIFVETANKIARSGSTFNLLGCNILNISPGSLIGGDIIRVKTENLSSDLLSNSLKIGDKESELAGISDDTLFAYVPYNVKSGNNEVSLSVNGKTCYSSDSLLIRNPWVAVTTDMSVGQWGYTGFSIADNGYIVIGSQLWKLSPGNYNWIRCAELPGESRDNTVGFSIQGKGYVCFGVGNGIFYNYLYEYDPIENAWSKKTNFPGPGRLNSVAIVIGGKAYLGLGQGADFSNVLRDFWEYDQGNDKWTRITDYPSEWGNETVGFALDNKAYIGLGTGDQIYPSERDFWEFDPPSGIWTRLADFPGTVRIMSTGFSIGKFGYMGTGWTNINWGTALNDFWRFDPENNKWIRLADIPYGERYASFSFVIGNKGYICAGMVEGYDIIEFNPN
jgi:N-acetylneuraminic acid mutarotase